MVEQLIEAGEQPLLFRRGAVNAAIGANAGGFKISILTQGGVAMHLEEQRRSLLIRKMGIFSKKPKVNPTIEFEGVAVEYKVEQDWWEFTFEGTEFMSHGAKFTWPAQSRLKSILNDIERLKPEMVRRLTEGFKDAGIKTNEGETYFVVQANNGSAGEFEVTWSGGRNWGDMGIDFMIENHEIVNEEWSD